MYVNYAVCGGGSVGLEDDFFPVEWAFPTVSGRFIWGGDWTTQCRSDV